MGAKEPRPSPNIPMSERPPLPPPPPPKKSEYATITGVGSMYKFNMEECLALTRQMQEKASELRKNWIATRDLMFEEYRKRGYSIYAVDRGMGEEWVMDDALYDSIKEATNSFMSSAGNQEEGCAGFPPTSLFRFDGIQLHRKSDFERDSENGLQ